ncbi:MAG: glycosyltransferase family 4 protein [Clostridia bacterium]|nr:glycosyltransferase family 4 protein [Clostridia bacterium]
MKIGIFTDTYNPVVSGVVTSINMLELEMKKRGHEVYVFAPSKSIKPKENQELFMLKSMPLIVARQYKNRIAAFYSRDIAKKIKELNLDIVHTQSEFGLGHFGKIISRKFNIPFIHTYHTMWEDYVHYVMPIKWTRKIFTKRLVRRLSRSFLRKAECVISPSSKTEKYLRYRCKVKNKPIYIIPTGIDIIPFKRSNFSDEERINLKESLGIKKEDKVILFLGRIAEEKSIDVIMDNMPSIFKEMPNAKFLIVGIGPSVDDLKEQAKKLNISDKVIFTGKIPWTDVPKYYNIGDVFVNASLTETQGLTFIEAMASSTPVVAKFAPNLSEFITNNKNGILVRKNADFTKAIINVLNNEKLANKLVENGLDTAKLYSVEEFADKLEKLYTEIIKDYKLRKTYKTKQEKQKEKKNLYRTITDELLKLTRLKK